LFVRRPNRILGRQASYTPALTMALIIPAMEIAGALLPNPAANTAINMFMTNMTRYNQKQCSINVVDKAVCNLSNLEISSCPNTTVACCNDSAVSVLTCTSSFISSQASSAMTKVLITQNPATKERLVQRLRTALVNGGTTSSNISSDVTKNFGHYINNICKASTVTEQNATMPSLRLQGCHDDVINVYNRSDVNIRCAAGAISHFFPALTPGPPSVSIFSVNSQVQTYLLVMGGVFGAFMVLLILLTVGKTNDNTTVI